MSKGAATRQQIVETALGHAAEIGLEGMTLGVLADQLGLSKSGLFAHFRSKEALQLSVLEEATRRFEQGVIRPALAAPRGEPRVVELIERWLAWFEGGSGRSGCVFISFASEFDDRPGPVREALVASQRKWREFIVGAVRRAIDEGHFRADLDPRQFAFEFLAIGMSLQHSSKLFADRDAGRRARQAIRGLIERSRARRRTPS